MAAIQNLHKTRIHAARKAGVVFNQRPLRGHGCGIHIGHHLHRVRVAHRNSGDFHLPCCP